MLFKFKSTAQRGITKIEEKAVSLGVGEDNYKYQVFEILMGLLLVSVRVIICISTDFSGVGCSRRA
jgi:hypothetical protein